jgi:hypothetical protein
MRGLAFVALSLGLAGCQTMGLTSSEPAEPAPAIAPPPAAAVATPDAVRGTAGNGVVGMTADALRAAWGEPQLKRTEAGAEMWQYGGRGNCTLLVYVYANASNVMTVTHAEALPGGSDEAALATCAKAAGLAPLKPIS